jgi:hypothetical protein
MKPLEHKYNRSLCECGRPADSTRGSTKQCSRCAELENRRPVPHYVPIEWKLLFTAGFSDVDAACERWLINRGLPVNTGGFRELRLTVWK